ncbi:MATE family efflux transporter [Methanobrevibacter sp. OttesenSCG-928-K11]|nr:MATE family efflux transporter [Methanobrevibacter sp. OttesenSCG-928-K11]MDL2271304.1 MATE family efflux transporter [Methanobrevibacter sp. OttesenSCG-928-I08]
MTNNAKTKGVETLLGEPKQAVFKLAIPMIIAMVINSLYTFIDSIWVAGLGDCALASVGFVNPLYLIILGFSNGIGAGATSVISRYIGAEDKKEADNAALHVLLLIVILSIFFTITLLYFLKPVLLAMDVGKAIDLSLSYGNILFAGSFFIVFTSGAYGLFRAEGNVKKTTYAMLFGAILNIILDPILIYGLNLGVKGAAIATITSLACVSLLLFYWFKSDTYLSFDFKDFKYKNKITKQILSISLPNGSEFLFMALLSASLNMILMSVSGVNGVATYNGGWKLVSLVLVPTIAIGNTVIAIAGANYGAKKYENLAIIQNYAIKLSGIISIFLVIFVFIFAPQISYLFAYGPNSADLSASITEFLRITVLYYIFVPFGFPSISIFRGIGKGLNSLVIAFLRALVFQIMFAYVLAVVLGLGKTGVWYGIVAGSALGSIISFIWAKMTIKRLIKYKKVAK